MAQLEGHGANHMAVPKLAALPIEAPLSNCPTKDPTTAGTYKYNLLESLETSRRGILHFRKYALTHLEAARL